MGRAESELALRLARDDRRAPLQVADIGCGTGAASLLLARWLNAHITAVDFLSEFLEAPERRAAAAWLADRITTLACSMDQLPFADEQFDLIWSEGAVYNIGFETGIRDWRRYLKAGGALVVSEITWLRADRPAELQEYRQAEYPEVETASAKIALLEKHGYSPLGYFVLPEHCWLENYYRPMQARFAAFLQRNRASDERGRSSRRNSVRSPCMRSTGSITVMGCMWRGRWGNLCGAGKVSNLEKP